MNNFNDIRKQIEDWMDELWEIIPDARDVENNLISTEDAYNLGKYNAYETIIGLMNKIEDKKINK